MRLSHVFLFLVFTVLLSACARVRSRSDITALNGIYQVRAGQTLQATNGKGQTISRLLTKSARAALFQQADTLYAAFVSAYLPPIDADSQTLDQADSGAAFFVHHPPALGPVERKSPWFYYQLTSFDVDLFTIPFKYRFATAQRPGELASSANLGIYTGLRYDLGRYRTISFRNQQRTDIQSFSFGLGTVLSIDPVLINEFNTDGRVTQEYEALGFNYGLATIVGYKSITAGLALGFENLADRNNRLWVYRQKPWLGLTVGININ